MFIMNQSQQKEGMYTKNELILLLPSISTWQVPTSKELFVCSQLIIHIQKNGYWMSPNFLIYTYKINDRIHLKNVPWSVIHMNVGLQKRCLAKNNLRIQRTLIIVPGSSEPKSWNQVVKEWPKVAKILVISSKLNLTWKMKQSANILSRISNPPLHTIALQKISEKGFNFD